MSLIARFGHFLFRTRNALFPFLLIAVVAIFQPSPLHANGVSLATFLPGLAVLLMGQGLRVLTIGLDYIRRGGKNGRIHADRLVTGGLFACCRNPMYTGNVLMIAGFFLISGNGYGIVIGTLLGWLVYRSIIASEEQFLSETFGRDYADYCAHVPRWIPSLPTTWRALSGYRFDWPSVVIREYGTLFTTVLIALALVAWKVVRADTLAVWMPVLIIVALLSIVAYGAARYLKKSRRLRPMERS